MTGLNNEVVKVDEALDIELEETIYNGFGRW